MGASNRHQQGSAYILLLAVGPLLLRKLVRRRCNLSECDAAILLIVLCNVWQLIVEASTTTARQVRAPRTQDLPPLQELGTSVASTGRRQDTRYWDSGYATYQPLDGRSSIHFVAHTYIIQRTANSFPRPSYSIWWPLRYINTYIIPLVYISCGHVYTLYVYNSVVPTDLEVCLNPSIHIYHPGLSIIPTPIL